MTPDPVLWDAQHKLDRIADKIQTLASSDPNYPNVSVHPATMTINIYRTPDSDGRSSTTLYDDVIPGGANVTFVPAVISELQIQTLDGIVRDARNSLTAAGIRIVGQDR